MWGKALDYFQSRGKDRDSLKVVGYYGGDTDCDVGMSRNGDW